MTDYIQLPKGGGIIRSSVVRWVVRDSPGYHDHQKVIVILSNGEEINSGMYERDWIKLWEAQQQ